MQGNLKGSAMGTLCFLFLQLNPSDTTSYRHYVEILLKFNILNSYLVLFCISGISRNIKPIPTR